MKDSDAKKTKLSIYLLKDGKLEDDDFLTQKLASVDIEDLGKAYKTILPSDSPTWVETFFENKIEGLSKSGSGVIYKVAVETPDGQKHFLLSFGYGFHRINRGACEERFGIRVALNAGNLNKVRSLDRKNFSSTVKQSRDQLARKQSLASFGIDYDQDMMEGLTLDSKDEELGATLVGGVGLGISTSNTISDVASLLPKLYNYYKATDYIDAGYNWIDNVSPVKGRATTEKLDKLLVDKINNHNDDSEEVWLCPPEIQEWDDIKGFSPHKKDPSLIKSEIELDDYRRDRSGSQITFDSIDQIKSRQVNVWRASTDNASQHWNLYRCIYCEITIDGSTYVLTNGRWYNVNKDFCEEIEKWHESLDVQTLELEKYEKVKRINKKTGKEEYVHSEKDYNIKIAEQGYALLDRDLVNVGPHRNIEACDLYKDGTFYHIKIFTGASAPISHLIAQATVATDLFFSEIKFRRAMNRKLGEEYKINEELIKSPAHDKFKIVLGIITNKSDLKLPFFTKVNLRVALRRFEVANIETRVARVEGEF